MMMMNWLDEIAKPAPNLEALRGIDPEKGDLLERVGALEPRSRHAPEDLTFLAKRCEAWEAEQEGGDRLAKVELPEDLRLPSRPKKRDSRRQAESEQLPWERKAKGEDAWFEAERAAAGRQPARNPFAVRGDSELEKAFVDGAPASKLKAMGEAEQAEADAELEAERDLTAGLEVRAQQLSEAIDYGQKTLGPPPVTTAIADTIQHQQATQLLKECGDAVRREKPDLDKACEFFEQHFERDMTAKGFDKKTRDALRPQIIERYFRWGAAQGVNPAALIYASAVNLGYRPPTTLTSIAKASDDDLKEELKNFQQNFQVQMAGLEGQLKERGRRARR